MWLQSREVPSSHQASGFHNSHGKHSLQAARGTQEQWLNAIPTRLALMLWIHRSQTQATVQLQAASTAEEPLTTGLSGKLIPMFHICGNLDQTKVCQLAVEAARVVCVHLHRHSRDHNKLQAQTCVLARHSEFTLL